MSSNDELITRLVAEVRDLQEAYERHKQQRDFHARMETETAENLRHIQATLDFLQSKTKDESDHPVSATSKPVDVNATSKKYDSSLFLPESQARDTEDARNFLTEVSPNQSPQRSPDDMRKPKYRDVNLIDVIGEVARSIGKPFKVDDAVPLIYDFENEDERQACRRSLNAGLSRSLGKVIDRYSRGVYVPKQQAMQLPQFIQEEYSQ